MIHSNRRKTTGPTHGGSIRKNPIVYKTGGGSLSTPTPSRGYFSSSVNYTQNIDPDADKIDIAAGQAYILGSAFPPMGSNSLPSSGHNPYEPIKIPFIHKFGGPHCANSGVGILPNSYIEEEFLRVKLPKDPVRNVRCPYSAATITAVTFPYGRTNKGGFFPDSNKTGVSVFRYRYPLHTVKPVFEENLFTYNPSPGSVGNDSPGFYAPLYSSSIHNLLIHKEDHLEFRLDTNPGSIDGIPSTGKHCIKDGSHIDMLSIHPEISEGNLENFNLPGEFFPVGNWSGVMGGANILQNTSNINIQHKCQGKTDGNDLSFFLNAQPGSIIKGIIELF